MKTHEDSNTVAMIDIEIHKLVDKGIKNPYAIMSIIQHKKMHKFGKDWRSIIQKSINRLNK